MECRPKSETPDNLSRKDAADYLGIHINTLDKSNIPRVRIGGRTLFRRKTLDKYLADAERKWKPQKRRAVCGK